MLNVAAGHDGVPQKTESEQFFKDAFGQQFAAVYPTLSPDLQQPLAQLPQLDAQTQHTWASLPPEQRAAIRDQWAAQVEDMQGNVTCAEYDALVRANLVPDGGGHDKPGALPLDRSEGRVTWLDPSVSGGRPDGAAVQASARGRH